MNPFSITPIPIKQTLFGLGLILLAGCNQPVQTNPHDEVIARIEQSLLPELVIQGQEPAGATIAERLAHHNVPGVSVAVMLNGELAWARGYGMADSVSGQAVTPQTLFQAASISKPVAGMAALNMVEDGLLSLDGDINTYLKSWQLPGEGLTDDEKVTIRRLLNHSAGTTVWGFPGYVRSEERITTKDVLTGDGNTDPIVVYKEPGESWRYSGGGYTVMQLAMEDVSGEDFASIMDSHVLEPLEMASSTFSQPLPEVWHDRAATGYRGSGELVEMNWHVYPEQAAAGLWTTPTDLLKYAASVQRAYAGSNEEILEPATTKEMVTPGMNNHGLGPMISGDGLHFEHGGANEGFRCFFTASIKDGYGAVIMTNSDNGSNVSKELLTAIATEYGWSEYGQEVREVIELTSEQKAKFVGTYRLEGLGEVEIIVQDGILRAEGTAMSEPSTLLAESEALLFLADGGERLHFEFEEGEVVAFKVSSFKATKVK